MIRRQRLRPLTEAEAYARCHGTRESEVRIVKLEPRRPRYDLDVSGEDLRRSFEAKLADRELEESRSAAPPDVVPISTEAGPGSRAASTMPT